jgi:hypothetical protein
MNLFHKGFILNEKFLQNHELPPTQNLAKISRTPLDLCIRLCIVFVVSWAKRNMVDLQSCKFIFHILYSDDWLSEFEEASKKLINQKPNFHSIRSSSISN